MTRANSFGIGLALVAKNAILAQTALAELLNFNCLIATA